MAADCAGWRAGATRDEHAFAGYGCAQPILHRLDDLPGVGWIERSDTHRRKEPAMASRPPSNMDFTKYFAEMKLPMLPDAEAFLVANRKNLETLSAANRIALEGAQAVARRHMEIVQSNMAELTEAMKALATADAPQAKAAKQAELLKQAYQHAVAHMKELSDLIQQSNAEALSLINHRFVEAMDEVKALAEKSTK
jgi:phasin family protein